MAFRIAGRQNVKISLFLNKGNEIAGIGEITARFSVRGQITAKGQDIFNSVPAELFQKLQHISLRQADAGKMGYALNHIILLDGGGDVKRIAGSRASRSTIGHADKIRVQSLQSAQSMVNRPDRGSPLGRKHLKGKNPLLGKQFGKLHDWNSVRRALAAAVIFLRLPIVSSLPRVFNPQSGLTHSFSGKIFRSMRWRFSIISVSPGIRGEWIS